MKKSLFNICAAIIITLGIFSFIPPVMEVAVAETGYLENVILEKLPGKERITLIVSQSPLVSVQNVTDGGVLVKLEDMFVPENLRRTFVESRLDNISRVIPTQQFLEGKQWAYLTVEIKEVVPFVVNQEGKNIYIDFSVSGLPEKKKTSVTAAAPSDGEKPIKKEPIKKYTDNLISLDFQDADIKSVLRLMAEYGNISIVAGDDVKGNVTLTMKNVPWEQALDTILDINGLAKKQMGNIISVITLAKKKKDEADKVKAEEDQRKAEDTRKEREIKLLSEKGLLKQILIEAKIVEATDEFVKNLGVQWGFGSNQSVAGGNYGLGLTGGSSTSTTATQSTQAYPSQIGFASSTGEALRTAAVNWPTVTSGTPSLGVVFGGSAAFLEVQLQALEATSTGKIISAPKVVTMEGIKATIKQGTEVPYVTPASGTSPATVSFKDALLKLEVKPKITDEGKISMEITANNDEPDYTNEVQGNPPIKKNEIVSTVVVQNGDTVVIGGIKKSNAYNAVSGLPWLQKVPVLGWLFKTDNTSKSETQILIFVTPKILQGGNFAESWEKIRNE